MRSLCFPPRARGAQAGRVLFSGWPLGQGPKEFRACLARGKVVKNGPEDCPHPETCQTSLCRKGTEIRQSVPSWRQQETPGSRPPRITPSQILSLPSGNKQKWPLLSFCQLKKPTGHSLLFRDGHRRGPCLFKPEVFLYSGPESIFWWADTATLEKLLNQEHSPGRLAVQGSGMPDKGDCLQRPP